ncbi:MAG: hypothetical protein WDA22_01175 [Bacteroidota bacterium]
MFKIHISKIKNNLYPYYLRLWWRKKIKSNNKDWIFGRVACMGQDVFKLTGCQIPFYNIQKGRVDYLLNLNTNMNLHARTSQVAGFMERNDIIPLVAQQEIFKWHSMGKPKLIYMDSFSELTDQLFINRIGKWSFCVNYNDISHSSEFIDKYEAKGLLPNEEIFKSYKTYFQFLRLKFPDTPIIFLHFPVKLDKREKFHVRYRFIKNAVDNIANELPMFYSISVVENIVDWPEEQTPGQEDFPYHYNKATYIYLAKKVQETGVFTNSILNQ